MELDLYDFNKTKAEVFLNRECQKVISIQSYPASYVMASILKEKLEDNDIPSTFYKAYFRKGESKYEANLSYCSIRISDIFYVKTKHGYLNKGAVEFVVDAENKNNICFAELSGYYVDPNGITTGYNFKSKLNFRYCNLLESVNETYLAIKRHAICGKNNLPMIK